MGEAFGPTTLFHHFADEARLEKQYAKQSFTPRASLLPPSCCRWYLSVSRRDRLLLEFRKQDDGNCRVAFSWTRKTLFDDTCAGNCRVVHRASEPDEVQFLCSLRACPTSEFQMHSTRLPCAECRGSALERFLSTGFRQGGAFMFTRGRLREEVLVRGRACDDDVWRRSRCLLQCNFILERLLAWVEL